jgi:hypothetical protein
VSGVAEAIREGGNLLSEDGKASSTNRLSKCKFLMCMNWLRNDVGSQRLSRYEEFVVKEGGERAVSTRNGISSYSGWIQPYIREACKGPQSTMKGIVIFW